jgi:uroporphyrinogen decarboxylase
MIYEIIPDLIEAGISCFQFDQPELYGSERLAREFGKKVVFCSPVDIQRIMPTGNRKIIEEGALRMVENFKRHCGGGLIVNDYGSWKDLHVKPEWAEWARDVVVANAWI